MNPRDFPWHERLLPERGEGMSALWCMVDYGLRVWQRVFPITIIYIIHYFCLAFFSSIFCFISLYRKTKRRREVMMLRR